MDLVENMYVRCPISELERPSDSQDNLIQKKQLLNSRDYLIGRIVSVDQFSETIKVEFKDPFKYRTYYKVTKSYDYPAFMIHHCELCRGSKVKYKGKVCKVVVKTLDKEPLYTYYLQDQETKAYFKASEEEIVAPFNEGMIAPDLQLKNYEFQNPSWYLGRTVVNKMYKILENSVLGFKELAGCKIFLMPHQLNAVMRCYQDKACRYMLADEVGMGKTIEASAVLKLYLTNNSSKRVLIVVPDALVEQWRVELFIKFNITKGLDINRNYVELISFSEVNDLTHNISYDFIIIDEVHRILRFDKEYNKYHDLSKNAGNILLLSATPLQKKTVEFTKLLRLLDPNKYDGVDDRELASLLNKQKKIVNSVMLIIDNIDSLNDGIDESVEDEIDIHGNKECKTLFEEVMSSMDELQEIIEDGEFDKICNSIRFESDDLGLQEMLIAVSYVCDNYQLEKKIIRNRRNILDSDAYESHIRPIRNLKKVLKYKCGNNEEIVFQELLGAFYACENKKEFIVSTYLPLLAAFYSSSFAFWSELVKCNDSNVRNMKELFKYAELWKEEESYLANHVADYMDNPDDFKHRFLVVLDYLDQELYTEKIVLFTSFKETFELYKNILSLFIPTEELAFFNSEMENEERELSVYRFQNEKECRIMLCDKSGGEGRNFQIADYVVHIDLPWDANEIEQRIGRLDRLERNPERPNVNSVVVVSEASMEEHLLNFWNKGMNVFNESLSGLEIVLEDINKQMVNAISEDIKYGLSNAVDNIVETTAKLKKEIKREQRFDTIGYLYKPINRQITKLVRYYKENENTLFASTMLNWASLAGLKPYVSGDIVHFSASSFSPNSAKNTLLIPPEWTEYFQSKQAEFVNKINSIYSKYKSTNLPNGLEIKGTFDRQTAINNDYLHFYAPGDAVFDCIVTNSINATKGRSTAFAMKGSIDWKGFIYTYSFGPNIRILLENGIKPNEIAYFRNFLTSEMAVVPVPFSNYKDISSDIVLSEYDALVSLGYKVVRSHLDHLGKRSKGGSGFLNIPHIYNVSNMEWFRNKYPKDIWISMVERSNNIGRQQAIKKLSRKSHLKELQEEIQRIIAAKVSSNSYYRNDDENYAALKKRYEIIFKCMQTPQITLESACFMWIVKQ